MRFDDKNDRKSKIGHDKFVLIRELWDRFISNSQASYKPSKNLTADEQLLPCRSRCSFIQYMPNKPDKFGIKFWLLCEVETKYTCNGFPYLGRDEEKQSSDLQGEFVVKKLIEPYASKGHCVVTDNIFSSHKLAKALIQRKTTFIGTVRKNKKELPPAVKKNLDDEKGCLIASYQCKPKKNVILISTDHEQAVIPSLDFNSKKKPNVILTYNSKKVGVDSVDQMSRIYNTRAPTRRWPVSVFYNILNIASINSWILFKIINKSSISRSAYILQLVNKIRDLAESQNNQLVTSPQIKRKTSEAPGHPVTSRKKCQIRLCNQNQSIDTCSTCKLRVCGACTASRVLVCKRCHSST